MRLGVLDIGSNTGHLLVVDAHGGAAPLPASSHKQALRLAEHLDDDGAVTKKGIKALTDFCASATEIAEDKGCEEMLGFATSAVRDAVNSHEVLAHVEKHSGVDARGALRRGRGAADLPGRTPLVRLVGRPAGGLRHRRRLAGDRGRHRRGARRRLVAAAGRGADGARVVRRRAPAEDDDPRAAQARSAPRSPATPATCCARAYPTGRPPRRRPSARSRASAVPRRAATARSSRGCSSSRPCREWIPKLMDDVAPTSSPTCPASRRVVPTRSCPGRWSPRRAWTSSTSPRWRSAPGRCARASSSSASTRSRS